MENDRRFRSFDDNGPLDETWRQINKFLYVDIPRFLHKGFGEPISLNVIDDQESLERAIYCLEMKQKLGIYRGEILGMVDEQSPQNIRGKFLQGQVILYSDFDDDSGTVAIDTPYKRELIDKSIEERNFVFTSTTLNVPASIIRPIRGNDESL